MKEIVKEHPLRPIILRFDVKKAAPDFEVRALEAYYRMHDRTWETLKNLQQHKDILFDFDIRITELEYMLLPIQQQLDFLEDAFRLEKDVQLPIIEEEFSIDIGDLNQDAINHGEELAALNKEILIEEQWYNDWGDLIYENEDWFDEQDDQGEELIHQVFSRYEEVSVDIVSLDRDQQEFFGVIADVKDMQTRYFDYAYEVLSMYTRVHELSEATYRRVERVNDFIDKNLKGRKK